MRIQCYKSCQCSEIIFNKKNIRKCSDGTRIHLLRPETYTKSLRHEHSHTVYIFGWKNLTVNQCREEQYTLVFCGWYLCAVRNLALYCFQYIWIISCLIDAHAAFNLENTYPNTAGFPEKNRLVSYSVVANHRSAPGRKNIHSHVSWTSRTTIN